MAQGIGQDRYQHFFYCALTISLSLLLVSETVIANPSRSKTAQQLPATSSNSQAAYSERQKLLQEAQQFLRQGSSQSRTNALAKYQQALASGRKMIAHL